MVDRGRWWRSVACGLCLAAVPGVVVAKPARGHVVLTPAVGTTQQVRVEGRVLSSAPGGSSVVARNVRRLATSNVVGAEVVVEFAGQAAVTRSMDDGQFEVTFTPPPGAPFPVGEAVVTARVGESASTSRAVVADPGAPFLVVSDFDDTVAVSNVVSKRGVLRTALLQEAETQPPVGGMAAFYRCLGTPAGPRPPLAFVSGSPIQYVDRVVKFLALNGFPAAGLLLRDVGPSSWSDYKQPVIRRLLTQFVLPVVFIGDSGEADPEVYAQLTREFPGRVKRVYLREAGRAADPKRFEGALLFRTAREAAKDAVAHGLADAACVERAFPGEPKAE